MGSVYGGLDRCVLSPFSSLYPGIRILIQARVHKAKPQPLTIYTRIYFTTPWRPELPPHAPFASVVEPLGNVTESSPKSQVYGEFEPEGGDVVLRKGRYYAGDGNSLEEVLGGWGVDTVVLVSTRFFKDEFLEAGH